MPRRDYRFLVPDSAAHPIQTGTIRQWRRRSTARRRFLPFGARTAPLHSMSFKKPMSLCQLFCCIQASSTDKLQCLSRMSPKQLGLTLVSNTRCKVSNSAFFCRIRNRAISSLYVQPRLGVCGEGRTAFVVQLFRPARRRVHRRQHSCPAIADPLRRVPGKSP